MKKYLFTTLAAASSIAFAVEDAVLATDGAAEASSMTVKDIITRGGGIMYCIVGLSIVALVLIVFYLLTLREKLIFPRVFIANCRDASEKGDLDQLKELCDKNTSPAATIISSALAQCADANSYSYETLRDAMEDEGSRQADILWQRIQYLMDVAVIAPMLGLLGTVWGMMISFSGLESGVNIINKADTLANGVSQAMFTTFGGLIVGIMAMAFHAFFRGHVSRLISGLETACGNVLRPLQHLNERSGK